MHPAHSITRLTIVFGSCITKKNSLVSTILCAGLFCSAVVLAQAPVQNINKNKHPNLAEAQSHVAEAYNSITTAQKDNRYDMHGHAQNAQNLLVQVSQELKARCRGCRRRGIQKKIGFKKFE